MYPKLAKLKAANADTISLLTVLTDEKKEDAIVTSSSGKISWPVAWDTPKLGLARRWVVEFEPQVFF
ncbi:hypothetical protein ABK046_50050, partial [Streptomyces caeruleatus]